MSASLVGSEMCIRDRCEASSPIGRGKHSTPQRAYLRSERPREMESLIEPVSYTHLTLPTICSV
eukprot:5225977-Alexandrium_andersonii.AAC.1